MDQAMKKSTPEFAQTWFAEQYIWEEVERDGVLVRDATPEQIKAALDFLRYNSDSGPANDATYPALSHPSNRPTEHPGARATQDGATP